MKTIKFAVYQSGFAVFGTGSTREEAIVDAGEWLEFDGQAQGEGTIEQVEELIQTRPMNGEFGMLTVDDSEFDSYLKNQGGYKRFDSGWYQVKPAGN